MLENGRLRVPHVEHDDLVHGLAHVTRDIGPDDPDYQNFLPLAVPECELGARRRTRTDDEAALQAELSATRAVGDRMLEALRWELAHGSRRHAS
jgi:hypothetical protein